MKRLVFLLVVLILICLPQLSQPAQTVTWMFLTIDPSTGAQVRVLKQMGDAVFQRSKGGLKFEFHQWAEFGYKGPEMLGIYSKGIEKIGELMGGYLVGEDSLLALTALPFLATKKDVVPMINAVRPYVEADLDKRGIKPLIFNLYPNILWNKFAVESKEDFTKLKLRVHAAVIPALVKLGATGVTLPAAEIYQALATGILTGVPFGYDSAIAFGLHEQTNFLYKSPLFNTASIYFVVNKKAFNSLPKDVQKILVDTAKEYEPKCIDVVLNGTPEIMEKIRARKIEVKETMDPGMIEWMRTVGGKPVWQQWIVEHPETKEALEAVLKVVGMSLK